GREQPSSIPDARWRCRPRLCENSKFRATTEDLSHQAVDLLVYMTCAFHFSDARSDLCSVYSHGQQTAARFHTASHSGNSRPSAIGQFSGSQATTIRFEPRGLELTRSCEHVILNTRRECLSQPELLGVADPYLICKRGGCSIDA